MNDYITKKCLYCDGRGVFLETIKPHFSICKDPKCPNFIIEMCPKCLGAGTLDWIENIVGKRNDSRDNAQENSLLKEDVLKEIEEKINKDVIVHYFSSDAYNHIFLGVNIL